jgi:hypothetical protein
MQATVHVCHAVDRALQGLHMQAAISSLLTRSGATIGWNIGMISLTVNCIAVMKV